ncbi:MAG: MYXO-CTERM sorting domain-containing protein [Myxococcota bacterium]
MFSVLSSIWLAFPLVLPLRASAQQVVMSPSEPNTVTPALEPPQNCAACHDGFDESPNRAWEGTMMANAMRDPLFTAALTIANQDIPGIGEFCLRCHTPPGWLLGHCAPGNLSLVTGNDWEGITCDACHRMTQHPDGPLIGNAEYTIFNGYAKTGTFAASESPHEVTQDPFLESAELCGVCHEVTNPLFQDFPIERTYSEWASSAFAVEGETCQDCHFPRKNGFASNHTGIPAREINLHRMVGGNAFIPRVLAGEYPELGRGDAFERTASDAEALLQEAAVVTIDPVEVQRGAPASFEIRVENVSGHKLPSGYPEGRRAWLEVYVRDGSGRELMRSGVYDDATQTLDRSEPQLRTYEARLGSDGVFSYHMVEQNQILFDGRIPPRGFVSRPDLAPVGREYPVQPDGTLAHWDLAPYTFDVPEDVVEPVQVTARLLYQTTTREFVEFLRDANLTDTLGQEMYDLWVAYGQDPPTQMELAVATFPVAAPPVTTLPDDEDEITPHHCGCRSTSGAPLGLLAPLVLAGVASTRRRREA